MRASQRVQSFVPETCQVLKEQVYGRQIYGTDGWRDKMQEKIDKLGAYINSGELEQADSEEQENEMKNTVRSLREINDCLMAEIKNRDKLSFEIYQKQEELTIEKGNKDKVESSVEAAEIRAQQATTPYEKTTAWESWLPLGGRPLEVNSIPILIAIACFFLVVALGLFLQMASVHLEIHSPLNTLFEYVGEQFGTKE
jgi:hypothetical protein